jgi:hypothetical protein
LSCLPVSSAAQMDEDTAEWARSTLAEALIPIDRNSEFMLPCSAFSRHIPLLYRLVKWLG